MDRQFVPIYNELLLEFDPGFRARGRRARAAYKTADQIAFEAVNAAAFMLEGKKTLRADARLFLTANLALMVTRPLLHPTAQYRDGPRQAELNESLESDARTIIEGAEPDVVGEISAAAVIRSLSQNMEKLRLKNWRLWDRAEQRFNEL